MAAAQQQQQAARTRQFRCTVEGCGKGYTTKQNLNTHVQSVHAKDHEKVAGTGYVAPLVKSADERVRAFKCTAEGCGMDFLRRGHLATHIQLVHEKARPFLCTVDGCGQSYQLRGALNRHIRSVHENDRPFACSVEGCGKAFSTEVNLTRHVRSVHERLKPFKCPAEGCGKASARRSDLNTHIRSQHKALYAAGITNAGATRQGPPAKATSTPVPSVPSPPLTVGTASVPSDDQAVALLGILSAGRK